jgi:hypothetical protein
VVSREHLHHLVDLLPDAEISTASRFLEFLVGEGPGELLSAADMVAVEQGDAEIARGELTSLDELKRELKL